jgi:hypothetical protein
MLILPVGLRPAAGANDDGGHRPVTAIVRRMFGSVLLSHAVPRAVPSAQTGLASGFGMEPGVSLSLWPPKLYGDVKPVSRPHLGNRTVDASNDCGKLSAY